MADAQRRKRAFAMGYLAGLGGLPLATLPGQADALYAYGSVVHPARPSGYDHLPYATMMFREDTHCLYLSDLPFFAKTGENGIFALYNNYKDVGIQFAFFQLHYDADGSEFWSRINSSILSIRYTISGSAADGWTNYDLPDLAGNVRIRGSVPIPVAPEGCREAVLGCRLGHIRRQQLGPAAVPAQALEDRRARTLRDSTGRYIIAKEDS